MSTVSAFPHTTNLFAALNAAGIGMEGVEGPSMTMGAADILGAMAGNARKRARSETIVDSTSYQQWQKYSIQGGKKRPKMLPML